MCLHKNKGFTVRILANQTIECFQIMGSDRILDCTVSGGKRPNAPILHL